VGELFRHAEVLSYMGDRLAAAKATLDFAAFIAGLKRCDNQT
jgi:hypothetical protein